jgi:Snf7
LNEKSTLAGAVVHAAPRSLVALLTCVTCAALSPAQVKEIKKLAAAGSRNDKSVRILARQLVTMRQTKTRMYEGKATLHSVQLQLKSQLAMAKVAGCMQRSTEVMVAMGRLVSIPELQSSMTEMAREMERAGLTEEIMSDALDDVSAGAAQSAPCAQRRVACAHGSKHLAVAWRAHRNCCSVHA